MEEKKTSEKKTSEKKMSKEIRHKKTMCKKIRQPDYQNCIANLPNSILKKWGLEPNGSSLPLADAHLEENYQNIVVILLDGMGKCILERNLEENGFFRTHLAGIYSSTFPPTTVAATTSILSGLTPCEHGWLGWDCYYPQVDKNVTVFLNVEQGTEEAAAAYNVPWTYCGYESIADKINKAGGKAYPVSPFEAPFPDTFEKICAHILELCQLPEQKYIYAYWNEPDQIMHETGCYSEASKELLSQLEEQVRSLSEQLTDTLIIVTADHGHMDSQGVAITDYPTLMECLVRMPSIEPRALNLFVKEEKKEQFEQEFHRLFGDKFLLWNKQKVLEERIFGTGKEHENFRTMLGDYLAIAVSDLSIYNTREEAEHFIGVHAGLTEDEMVIPFIVSVTADEV